MLPGDKREAAEYVAQQIGIDRVLAEILPDGKAAAMSSVPAMGSGVQRRLRLSERGYGFPFPVACTL